MRLSAPRPARTLTKEGSGDKTAFACCVERFEAHGNVKASVGLGSPPKRFAPNRYSSPSSLNDEDDEQHRVVDDRVRPLSESSSYSGYSKKPFSSTTTIKTTKNPLSGRRTHHPRRQHRKKRTPPPRIIIIGVLLCEDFSLSLNCVLHYLFRVSNPIHFEASRSSLSFNPSQIVSCLSLGCFVAFVCVFVAESERERRLKLRR